MAVNYNIIDKSINTALDNFEISGGKTYIILLEAPTGANVRIRLDDNTADEIPLDTNYGLKFSKATRIYVSADAVSGQAIKIGVSDTTTGEFEVLPSPTVDQIDTIGEVTTLAGISTALNTALDKIINPYLTPTITQGSTTSTSLTTLLNKTLTCNKIRFILSSTNNSTPNYIELLIDGVKVDFCGWHSRGSGASGYFHTPTQNQKIIENVNGKTILIRGNSDGSLLPITFLLEEFTLKA